MTRAAKGKSTWALVLGLAAGLLAAALPATTSASAEVPSYAETRVRGFEVQNPAGVGAERGLSTDATRGYGESYDEEAVGYPLVPRGTTGAESAFQGAQLRTHLRLQAEYGQAGVSELANGRFRYYGELRPPRTAGEMIGQRTVREWDPATGLERTWLETVDAAGNVRIVRPETGGPKVHYLFDAEGNYVGQR